MMAVLALTSKAAALGGRVREAFPGADLFVPERYRSGYPGSLAIEDSLGTFVSFLWPRYTRFVFVMAAGIVVRTVAPLLKSKLEDPAVVVLDEQGRYAIPLLSGHLGGANELAREIAARVGAVPVITTASDVEGIPAVDDLARNNNGFLENLQDWKKIALALLEQKPVGLYSTVGLEADFPPYVRRLDSPDDTGSPSDVKGMLQGMIYITEKILGAKPAVPHVILRPRNIIVGIGCKKGKTKQEITAAVEQVLHGLQVSPCSIAHLATVELKKDEPGLVETAAALGVPLKWVSAGEIKEVEEMFCCSEFVSTKVGAGAVAEPSAWLTARKPHLLTPKVVFSGITIAVVKDLSVVIS